MYNFEKVTDLALLHVEAKVKNKPKSVIRKTKKDFENAFRVYIDQVITNRTAKIIERIVENEKKNEAGEEWKTKD